MKIIKKISILALAAASLCLTLFLASCTEDDHVHAYNSEITTPATCNKAGEKTLKCSCGSIQTEAIPATGMHTPTEIEAMAPGCFGNGSTAGTKCSVCSKILSPTEEIPPQGHVNAVKVEAKAASCTEAGNLEYYACPDCNGNYDGKTTEANKLSDVIIPAKGHANAVKFEAKAASCAEAGNLEYYACPDCGKNFDGTAPDAQVLENVVLPAKGHANAIKTERNDASCTEAGNVEYYACPDCGKNFDGTAPDANEIEETIISAKGHNEVEIPAKNPTCIDTGYTAGVKCSNCDEIFTAPVATDEPPTGIHVYEGGVCTGCLIDCEHEKSEDKDTCSVCGIEYVDYTIKFVDTSGAPISDLFMIRVFRKGNQVQFTATSGDGTAVVKLPKMEYTFTVDMADTYSYMESECVLTPDAMLCEVVIADALGEKVEIWGQIDPGYAYNIATGNEYRVSFDENMSYFIFTTNETGVYQISLISDAEVFVGIYGGPMFVLLNDTAGTSELLIRVNAYTIQIDVANANVSEGERQSTKYVIGIRGSAAGTGVLKVERASDHEITPEDLPYNPYGADLKPEFYAPEGEVTLENLDLADPNLKIVLGDDGYYHYMTEDGPIVLVKLELASQYTSSFKEMCQNQGFTCYIYDENGEFQDKVSYHSMMLAYIAACDKADGGIGAYPLDEHLMTAIKNVGEYRGWYDLDSQGTDKVTHIFGEDYDLIIPENAWMFALCYITVEN